MEGEGEADDVLRAVVATLTADPGTTWAGIAFLEEGELVLGPESGSPDEGPRARVPIVFGGDAVGELWVDGDADAAVLEKVAELISPYVLIGWDTGGELWEP
jgi:putative methionine-R-sulfoxide reductase with GAF domain